jgi:hypothetical protein
MSTPPPAAPEKPYCPIVWLKTHLTPYHLTVAAVLALATAGFTALIAVLLLISANFNLLGFVE